jgi:1,4-alpha-glucan branching enzyme
MPYRVDTAVDAHPAADLLRPRVADLERILEGRHHDPHSILGAHIHGARLLVLARLPLATEAWVDCRPPHATRLPLRRIGDSELYAWAGAADALARPLRFSWRDASGAERSTVDPYSFASLVSADDLERFTAGRHHEAWKFLGARPCNVEGTSGVGFAVWAPDAERVSVVGPFCQWDGRHYPMRSLGSSGVWELFLPGLGPGELYKFEIRNRATGALLLKSDPYMREAELRPATASQVATPSAFSWGDSAWMEARARGSWLKAPMSIYELHLGSWRRGPDGGFLNYREIAAALVPYVVGLGFTHVELMPITEYPLDDSWGYQTTGYFAPTRRHGTPDDLKALIDACHRAGVGVLLDWVPAHFPRDAHALANFDGTALYEYPDPRRAEHRDWGTLVFNYERHEVRCFLVSSACFWLEEFHFDGLRVDAVASMLYLDFSRRKEDFVRNRYGGTHNLEAIDFLRELNATTHARFPGTVVIAEESTDWPLVSRPTSDGGLGFSMKWNMGWMHDTLAYFRADPILRSFEHERLTFGMLYAFNENFVLPLSHDEVVHLKRSLLDKMPGDPWQRFANLRLLYAYQWTWPGKKLLFMGSEFGQWTEWDFRAELPWALAREPWHAGIAHALADLNRLYVTRTALHARDFDAQGFQWIDCRDRSQSVVSYLRRDGEEFVLVVLNFTPVPRHDYRVGVPQAGAYREIFNSDSSHYGGSNLGNLSLVEATPEPASGQPWSLLLTLPPLAAIILEPMAAAASGAQWAPSAP